MKCSMIRRTGIARIKIPINVIDTAVGVDSFDPHVICVLDLHHRTHGVLEDRIEILQVRVTDDSLVAQSTLGHCP